MDLRESTLMPMLQNINGELHVNLVNADTYSLNHGDIYLNCDIDDDTAKSILQQIIYLNSSSVKIINIWIDSRGGCCKSELAILNTMEMCKKPIRTIVTGIAASAASLILASGTPGQRYAFPDARVMLHDVYAGTEGKEYDIKNTYDRITDLNNKSYARYSKITGKPVEYLKKMMEKDTYFNAVEAKKFKLIDKICTKNFLNNL